MEPDKRRHAALIITICLVLVLTGFMAWGVLHKINKLIFADSGPGVVDIQEVPTTKEK